MRASAYQISLLVCQRSHSLCDCCMHKHDWPEAVAPHVCQLSFPSAFETVHPFDARLHICTTRVLQIVKHCVPHGSTINAEAPITQLLHSMYSRQFGWPGITWWQGLPTITLVVIFMKSKKCAYHITFDLNLYNERSLMYTHLETIMCNFCQHKFIVTGEIAVFVKWNKLTERDSRLTHCFALFWGLGLCLGYLATNFRYKIWRHRPT